MIAFGDLDDDKTQEKEDWPFGERPYCRNLDSPLSGTAIPRHV